MRRSLRVVLAGTATLAVIGGFSRDAAAQQPVCTTPKTTCAGNAGYYASTEDVDRLTAVADPLLRELRTCLDAGGANIPQEKSDPGSQQAQIHQDQHLAAAQLQMERT